jgi:predicted acetyltransferase
MRYHLDLTVRPPQQNIPSELIERSGEEAGEKEFIRGISIITSDSLDTEDQLRIKTFGLEQAAKNFFTMERSRDTSMERWKFYYTKSGEFAGLVIPQFLHQNIKGTIGHIGVAPKLRGNGYGKFILTRAHQILAAEGVSLMVDDCDDTNIPSKKIMENAGYKKQFTKEYYKKELRIGRIFAS